MSDPAGPGSKMDDDLISDSVAIIGSAEPGSKIEDNASIDKVPSW